MQLSTHLSTSYPQWMVWAGERGHQACENGVNKQASDILQRCKQLFFFGRIVIMEHTILSLETRKWARLVPSFQEGKGVAMNMSAAVCGARLQLCGSDSRETKSLGGQNSLLADSSSSFFYVKTSDKRAKKIYHGKMWITCGKVGKLSTCPTCDRG